MGRKLVSPLAKIFFKGYISHWFIEHSGDFIHPIRFPRSMKKWINKSAQWFVPLVYQEHCEEQMRISESRKTLRNWIVKAPKTCTSETSEASCRMLKKAVQRGRRRIETGGVPSGVR